MSHFWYWLERKWSTPKFSGGLLTFLTLFFFGAATNTLSGWLYVISGVSIALLLIGSTLPARSLQQITVNRQRIEPVCAGDFLTVEVWLENTGKQPRSLLECRDKLPVGLASDSFTPHVVIECIEPNKTYCWQYSLRTSRRGVFMLSHLEISTAAPLGLFRSSRDRQAPRSATIYPLILPLEYCPLLDQMGVEHNPRPYTLDLQFHNATEGLTKNLRPYRWGDPIRLIHWRTSARYGELRVRELEITTGGKEVVIALDTRSGWQESSFEQAVIVAASLYNYADRQNLQVTFWSPITGFITGALPVYQALAEISPQETSTDRPDTPLIWLTDQSFTLDKLPPGSSWIYWGNDQPASTFPGLMIGLGQPDKELPIVLQSHPG